MVGNHGLQAVRHIATNACDEVEIGCRPLLCDEAFEFLHGARVSSVHSLLEIVPQLFDRIEVGTPGGPVDEVDAVIVEPLATRRSFMLRRVVLLKPPLPARPELMSRTHEIQMQDGLVASCIEGIIV